MNILFFIPAFLLFLYCLYKLIKDDYVFIRKNVSTEQIFDIAFIILWSGLFFSRVIYMVFYPVPDQNIFLSFFTLNANSFSITGLVLGASIGLYLIGKYKKLPLERLFDIFAMAFSIALPAGLLLYMIFLKEYLLLIIFINALLYGVFAFLLVKYFHPKYIIFMLFFLLISLADILTIQFLQKKGFITGENIFIATWFIFSLILLGKQKLIK